MCSGCSIVVDPLFDNLNRLQLAHPDPVNEEEEEDEDDGMMMTADGLVSVEDHVCNLFAQAAVRLLRILSLVGRVRTQSEPLSCLFYTERSFRWIESVWEAKAPQPRCGFECCIE